MAVIVYTARVDYGGADRLDITRASGTGWGLAFAPSWALLRPFLAARRRREPIEPLWPAYVSGYLAEMRASYRGNFPAWQWLLARERATLVCYCTDARHCHRTVLATVLGKLGAEVIGELHPEGR